MKLTTMSRYGTRAIFDIAYNSTGFPVQVKDIAERQQIPIKYLEQIFHKLKKTDFLKSERGPGGGYVLTKDPGEITVGDIIRAVREDTDLVSCVCDSANNGKPCVREDQCVTRAVWQKAARQISDYFNSVTMMELCEEARRKNVKKAAGHPFEYSI
jgi:Rrf2 family iron-sulfur cluster assembly transcriptional regulator